MKTRSDKTLADPPTETISSVKFLPSSDGVENLLVAASWDGSLTLYDYHRNVNMKYKTDDMPVLSVSPVSSSSVCYGGLAQTVFVQDVDITRKGARAVTIGRHNDTICSVSYNKLHSIIVSGGYDSTIRLWSTNQNKEDTSVGTIITDKEVLCMDVRDNLVAAGISGGLIKLWDLRNLSTPLKVSEKNSLNLQCIAIFPDQKKFVYGTAEGRATVESIDSSKEYKGDFTFKPHVDKAKGIDHPVNAVSLQWLAYLEFSHSREEVHELSWESIPEKIPLSQKLWEMIQNGGIPHSLRPQMWCRLSPALEKKSSLANLPYWKVVKESTANEYFSYAKHIEKDLVRILPGNGCFAKLDSPGIPRLRRVLRAISWLYPDVGYCQGFGTVVAHLLLLLEEEDCFWLVCTIIEDIVPASYFTNDFVGIRTDSLVLANLVAEHFPEVDVLLKEHDIELGLIVFTWFLTFFASVVHVKILLRIWDMFFAEGCTFLFKTMLALVKFKVKDLLTLKNSAEIFNFLSDLPASVDDFDALEINEFDSISHNKLEQERKKCYSSVVSDGSVFSSKCRRVKKRDFRKLEKSKSSANVLKTIFGENGGPEDMKTKNIRQTEIMVELHDSITQIGRHFISSDQNFMKVTLEPDFSKESHAKDFERFVQGYNLNGYKRAKALVDFERRDDDELGFRKNDIINVINCKDEHCWIGDLNGLRGWFPAKCVTLLDERSKLYSAAGDDSVTEGIADLIRGSLCPCLKRIFENGMKRPSTLVGPVHPYMFIEEVALKEIERDFKSVYSRLVLCKTYRLDEDGKVLSPEELLYRSVELVNRSHDKVQMDVKLRSLICLGLNEQVLHLWIEILCSCSEIVNKWYHPWSIINSPGWIGLKCELRILSQFSFNLSVDWELKMMKEQKLDVKSGVQDMLVKHHLFSWNL